VSSVFFKFDVGIGSGFNIVNDIDNRRTLLLGLVIDTPAIVVRDTTIQHGSTTTTVGQ